MHAKFQVSWNSSTLKGGEQLVQNGKPVFGAAGSYGWLTILSTFSWGLGYFGMPQVLLRFMAIRDSSEIKMSRRIATVWVFISLLSAVSIGLIGRVLFPTELLTAGGAEIIIMSKALVPAFLAGFVMAGILAATISSSDSYLLIAASAVAKNIYQGLLKKDATEKQVMWCSRFVLIAISIIAIFLAADEQSVIFNIVSFAWAGFGATFGPVILTSVFWRGATRNGALAGMIAGGSMVFIWKLLVRPMGGVVNIYELLPAFLFGLAVILIVSTLDKKDPAVLAEFDQYQAELKRRSF